MRRDLSSLKLMDWESVAENRAKWQNIVSKRLLKEEQEKLKRKTEIEERTQLF